MFFNIKAAIFFHVCKDFFPPIHFCFKGMQATAAVYYITFFSQPYQAYARYGSSISRPQTRNSLGQRAYSYASMADADWGWKKR